MPFRGFVAVEVGPLPPLLRLADALSASGADVKVVAPENLHVTLRFLGDVPEDKVPALEAAMREAVAGEPPFTMRLAGAGQFPPRGAARVHWVGLRDADPLARVAARLERALEPLGWPPEGRSFAAHVTVARARSPAGADRARAALAAAADLDAPVRVERVVLMRSDLGRAGPTYAPVAHARLEAPA